MLELRILEVRGDSFDIECTLGVIKHNEKGELETIRLKGTRKSTIEIDRLKEYQEFAAKNPLQSY